VTGGTISLGEIATRLTMLDVAHAAAARGSGCRISGGYFGSGGCFSGTAIFDDRKLVL
jgi:hypothetical protein